MKTLRDDTGRRSDDGSDPAVTATDVSKTYDSLLPFTNSVDVLEGSIAVEPRIR